MRILKKKTLKFGDIQEQIVLFEDDEEGEKTYLINFNEGIWGYFDKQTQAAIVFDMMKNHIKEYISLEKEEEEEE
jgi:hypothetical protein